MSILAILAAAALTLPQAQPAAQPAHNHESDCKHEVVPDVVTADIAAGIEKHIEQLTAKGGGYMTLPYEGKELRLKLVRIHLEYLANLGPRKHFACVDMASAEGEVFDVDFFMEGDPGNMTVTETTIHKLNGQPFYLWEEKDGTWVRVKVEGASHKLLGIIEGTDQFEFLYQATLPKLTENARMWVPVPVTDNFQAVTTKELRIPGKHRYTTDKRYGNKILFIELTPADSGKTVLMRFDVIRKEKAAYADSSSSAEQFLAPEKLVPDAENIRALAAEATAGKKGELVKARALYDHTIERMKYMKYGNGWGKGDLAYACDARSGNCTDFHAYFIGLCRASGIPARFAIGAAIPSERNNAATDGYHCWAEFYAEGKWWPVDISEADKYAALATYYFGHHPANRLELSRGRDLEVDPAPASGPINFHAFPVLEVGDKSVSVRPTMSFKRTKK